MLQTERVKDRERKSSTMVTWLTNLGPEHGLQALRLLTQCHFYPTVLSLRHQVKICWKKVWAWMNRGKVAGTREKTREVRSCKLLKLSFLARKPNATGSDWTHVREVSTFPVLEAEDGAPLWETTLPLNIVSSLHMFPNIMKLSDVRMYFYLLH